MDSIPATAETPIPSAGEPLPENIRSVQPGGGWCYALELAWGRWRRWYLKAFRPGYVARMAAARKGDAAGAPHELLDPRDLKFCRNQTSAHWEPANDHFHWRERLPFARWGLAELLILGLPLSGLTILFICLSASHSLFWLPVPIATGVLLFLVVYFFRDPYRQVPVERGLVVSPADGEIAEITRLPHDDFIGGPAVRIGIFLSIFNVHLNRSPIDARVLRLRYHPGKFLNALNPESAIVNENMVIGLEELDLPYRRMVVRQIAGLFARKIVCDLKPGEAVSRGQKFGMIKLGSRTELILPDVAGLEILVAVGHRVSAGSGVLARLPKPAAQVERE